MKVEGIPAKLDVDVKHTHVVAVEIVIDKETTKNVQDLLITAGSISVIAYTAKKIVDFSQRGAFELFMREVWKR